MEVTREEFDELKTEVLALRAVLLKEKGVPDRIARARRIGEELRLNPDKYKNDVPRTNQRKAPRHG